MSTIRRTHVVNVSIEQAWAEISDVTRVKTWHPKVRASPALTDHVTGLGATRRCEFYDGTSVVEEVVAVTEGRSVTLKLSEFSMPLREASATLSLKSLGPSVTEVSVQMDYSMKFGPLGWMMDQVMVKSMMDKMFAVILAGFAHHLATGEAIGEDFDPAVLQQTSSSAAMSSSAV